MLKKKGEIESIRGIKCDRVIEGLIKKNLIEEVGRSTGIGRPILYGTTKLFLEKFGLKNIKELPDIEDIGNIVEDIEETDTGQISLEI
jgi:segregation and condensation protein B